MEFQRFFINKRSFSRMWMFSNKFSGSNKKTYFSSFYHNILFLLILLITEGKHKARGQFLFQIEFKFCGIK